MLPIDYDLDKWNGEVLQEQYVTTELLESSKIKCKSCKTAIMPPTLYGTSLSTKKEHVQEWGSLEWSYKMDGGVSKIYNK